MAAIDRAVELRRPVWQQTLRMCGVIMCLLAGALCVILSYLFYPFLHPQRWLPRATQLWHKAVLIVMGVKVKSYGLRQSGLCVCNHISWLDIMVLGAATPTLFVAKAELRSWPLIGWLAAQAGTLFVHRQGKQAWTSNANTATQITARLQQGERVMLFPEGTSSNGQTVLAYRARLLTAATENRVLPCVLHYAASARECVPFVGNDSFFPHLWRLLGVSGLHVTVYYLDAVTGKDARTLASTAHAQTLSLLRCVSSSAAPFCADKSVGTVNQISG